MTEVRMGRPPKTSSDQILDAAALCAPGELQLTAVAAQLGIAVKTVTYYFPTRKALLDALTERAVVELGMPDASSCHTGREVLAELARWSYRLGRNYPGWFFDSVGPRAVGVRAIQVVIDRLLELGVSEVAALNAYAIVGNWAIATGEAASRTRSMGGLSPDNVREFFADYTDADSIEQLTLLLSDIDLDDHFATCLEIVLDGLDPHLVASA